MAFAWCNSYEHLLVVRHATGNRASEVVLVGREKFLVASVTDKAKLDEHCWHPSVFKYEQLRIRFYASVDCVERIDNLILDTRRELFAIAAIQSIHKSFGAAGLFRSGAIAMDTDKNISVPVIGRLCDRRALPICVCTAPDTRRRKIIALHQLARAACYLKIMLDERANAGRDITLAQPRARADSTAVVVEVVSPD